MLHTCTPSSNRDELFPGTDIKGGIAVTHRDDSREVDPIGTFTKYPELNSILHKVWNREAGEFTLGFGLGRSIRAGS